MEPKIQMHSNVFLLQICSVMYVCYRDIRVCVRACMRVCAPIVCACTCTCMRVCMHSCVRVCEHTYGRMWVCVCMLVHAFACICICAYVSVRTKVDAYVAYPCACDVCGVLLCGSY